MENLILKQDELATTASVKAMTENLINGVNNGEIDPLKLQVTGNTCPSSGTA